MRLGTKLLRRFCIATIDNVIQVTYNDLEQEPAPETDLVTKKSATPRVPKNKRSKRTSMWLDNGLRRALDERAKKEARSLANTIEFYLRKGLGLKTDAKPADEGKTDAAPIFG